MHRTSLAIWHSKWLRGKKNPPAMQETWVPSLHWEDPLEKGKATQYSILAQRILYSPRGCKESDVTDFSLFFTFAFFFFYVLIKFLFIYLFFYFTVLYWFCHTSTCIHHGCTCVPHPEPPIPPPSPYHPSGSSQCTSPKLPVSCIKPVLVIRFLQDIIRFNAILPNHPPLPLPQSPKDCSIHLCLFCLFENYTMTFPFMKSNNLFDHLHSA